MRRASDHPASLKDNSLSYTGVGTPYKPIISMIGAVQIASLTEGMAIVDRAGLDLAVIAEGSPQARLRRRRQRLTPAARRAAARCAQRPHSPSSLCGASRGGHFPHPRDSQRWPVGKMTSSGYRRTKVLRRRKGELPIAGLGRNGIVDTVKVYRWPPGVFVSHSSWQPPLPSRHLCTVTPKRWSCMARVAAWASSVC